MERSADTSLRRFRDLAKNLLRIAPHPDDEPVMGNTRAPHGDSLRARDDAVDHPCQPMIFILLDVVGRLDQSSV